MYVSRAYLESEIDTAQQSLESNDDKVWSRNKDYFKGLVWARRILLDAPAEDVKKVVHGEWLEIDDGVLISNGKHIECSECGTWKKDRERTLYCPYCGTQMDKISSEHIV